MKSVISRISSFLKRHSYVRLAVIFVLVLLCAFELDAVLQGFRSTYGVIDPYLTYRHGQILRESGTMQPSEIQPWMTFQYVNFVFKLPPSYLSGAFGITDSHYPNIQIARYAKAQGLDLATFLARLKQAVGGYTPQKF